MKIEFTGRHIEVTPALKAHVDSHFEKIEHLFVGKQPKVHVIIEVERGRHRSEVIVNWRNEMLTGASSNADMYRSLTLSIEKVEKQARKLKDKVIDKSHRARKAAVVGAEVESVSPARQRKIVLSKKYRIKPMTADEAALMLNGEKNGWILFRDSESGGVSLLYARPDGDLGLIQT